MEKASLWKWPLEWAASHSLWELFKLLVAELLVWIGSWGWARLMNSPISKAFDLFLIVGSLVGILWTVGLLPKRKAKSGYSIAEMRGKISVFLIGFGPQLYVTAGKGHLTIETIQLAVVNLMPLPVDLENMQVDILLDGTNLATKDANIPRRILGSSVEEIQLRHELTDNQAKIAREYRDRFSSCPIFKIGGMANFRTSQGLVAVRVETGIRCVIHKDS